jgi:hypothetical protein
VAVSSALSTFRPALVVVAANQLDHGYAIDEGASAPSLRDVAEQAMTLTFPGLKLRRLTFNRRNASQSSQAIHTMTCGALT